MLKNHHFGQLSENMTDNANYATFYWRAWRRLNAAYEPENEQNSLPGRGGLEKGAPMVVGRPGAILVFEAIRSRIHIYNKMV